MGGGFGDHRAQSEDALDRLRHEHRAVGRARGAVGSDIASGPVSPAPSVAACGGQRRNEQQRGRCLRRRRPNDISAMPSTRPNPAAKAIAGCNSADARAVHPPDAGVAEARSGMSMLSGSTSDGAADRDRDDQVDVARLGEPRRLDPIEPVRRRGRHRSFRRLDLDACVLHRLVGREPVEIDDKLRRPARSRPVRTRTTWLRREAPHRVALSAACGPWSWPSCARLGLAPSAANRTAAQNAAAMANRMGNSFVVERNEVQQAHALRARHLERQSDSDEGFGRSSQPAVVRTGARRLAVGKDELDGVGTVSGRQAKPWHRQGPFEQQPRRRSLRTHRREAGRCHSIRPGPASHGADTPRMRVAGMG